MEAVVVRFSLADVTAAPVPPRAVLYRTLLTCWLRCLADARTLTEGLLTGCFSPALSSILTTTLGGCWARRSLVTPSWFCDLLRDMLEGLRLPISWPRLCTTELERVSLAF